MTSLTFSFSDHKLVKATSAPSEARRNGVSTNAWKSSLPSATATGTSSVATAWRGTGRLSPGTGPTKAKTPKLSARPASKEAKSLERRVGFAMVLELENATRREKRSGLPNLAGLG